jgi:hypothetical protein
MPLVVGIAAALWVLVVLAVIGAVLVGTLVLSMTDDMRKRFGHQRASSAGFTPLEADDQGFTIRDFVETEDWHPYGWSDITPASWWSDAASARETIVIDGGYPTSATAVADKRTTSPTVAIKQIWTIHPDHTAHWQDEAGDCPWCRNEPV